MRPLVAAYQRFIVRSFTWASIRAQLLHRMDTWVVAYWELGAPRVASIVLAYERTETAHGGARRMGFLRNPPFAGDPLLAPRSTIN